MTVRRIINGKLIAGRGGYDISSHYKRDAGVKAVSHTEAPIDASTGSERARVTVCRMPAIVMTLTGLVLACRREAAAVGNSSHLERIDGPAVAGHVSVSAGLIPYLSA